MSNSPEADLDLDKIFLPSWAQEPATVNRFAHYTGNEGLRPERGRDERRGGPRPPRRDGGPAGRSDSRPPRRDGPGAPGPRGPEGARSPGLDVNRGPGRRDDRRDDRRGDRRDERREPPMQLPEVNVTFMPDDRGIESLVRQIKMTGRAYPLFDIAQMILQKPERQGVRFDVIKKQDGTVIQPLFSCAIDDTLWLSEAEAVAHVLDRHFNTFYQVERNATEPPKGTYTFVAQCGMSGAILGPPNHHDYQNQLRKLHADRFSRMPFEVYKSRVKIVKDPEVVKKWVEEQSFKTEFLVLNVPDTIRLPNREAVEQHFRETHVPVIIKQVETMTMVGTASRNMRCTGLQRLVRLEWEDQRRFPIKMATILSQQFTSRGLQLFKRDKSITHVCVARPHFLDLEAEPVSDGVRRIVEYVNSHPKSTRHRVIEALSPSPVVTAPAAPAPVAPTEGAPAPAAAAPQAPLPEPTAEQHALNADIHWLIHQGHIIEFADGVLETAKKPLPKPPRPEPKAKAPAVVAKPEGIVAPQTDAAVTVAPAIETPVAEQAPVTAPEPAPAPEAPVAAPETETPAAQ